MSSRRSGSATIGLLSTSSTAFSLRNRAFGVLEAVLRVLHLHPREVVAGRAVDVHASTRVQREVHRVGGTEQVEAQPVGVVLAIAAADGGEEALRRGVGADHEHDVGEAGEDLRTCLVQCLRARRARGVVRRHAHAGPAELLRERGAGDEAGVAVADGVGAGDVLDVAPRESGVGERGTCRDHAVLGEVASPLAPRVHADAEDGDVAVGAHCDALGTAVPRAPTRTRGTRARRRGAACRARAASPCRPSGRRPARPWPPGRAPRCPRRRARPRRARTARTDRRRRTAPAARSGSRCTTTPDRGASSGVGSSESESQSGFGHAPSRGGNTMVPHTVHLPPMR